jgi:hypothetical protein
MQGDENESENWDVTVAKFHKFRRGLYELVEVNAPTKNASSPVRAAAAKQLARDTARAPRKRCSGRQNKKWQARAATLEAIAQRGDPSLATQVVAALDDEKNVVRFTAAACVVHLNEIPREKTSAEPSKP